MSFSLLIRHATLPDGRSGLDIGVRDGVIAAIEPNIVADAATTIEAAGDLVAPPFIDCHLHLDSTLSLGQPRLNQSGTLLEGIALWGELKPHLTVEAIHERARRLCMWSIAQGIGAIRSHVDICDDRLLAVEALTALRDEMAPYITLQLVAFPQDGFLRYPKSRENLHRALAMGVDMVGGIPHFERTMAEGTESVRQLMAIAAERGLRVDMHCDESDDPLSRHIETLAGETIRHGMQGRVAGSHLTSLHSMDNYYASKLIPLIAEAGVSAIANPLINITLQGRHDTYPKRRGMTRVPELMAAGVNVAFGHDCVLDPWYPLGSHDMLEVASMGLHVAQMTGVAAMRACFDAVTINPARAMGLTDHEIAVGNPAHLIVLDASDPIEAIRTCAAKRAVIRAGNIIAAAPPRRSIVTLGHQTSTIDWRLPH
ncbi:MAG: amidohydrolase family protein [Acidiphilium sp.]|nr:amidohydrolase family protein [Acidiphilium sp.]MDD4935358.1 amidohydrolase family protein [Acidiphilium sp.]